MEPKSIDELLEAALLEPIGIKVKTDSPDTLKRKLYAALKRARDGGDFRFVQLTISGGVVREEVLIRKKELE